MNNLVRTPLRHLRRGLLKSLARVGYCSKPSFLIIGAQKSGTSALFSMLGQHPQLVAPRNKEPTFFNDKEVRGGIQYGCFADYHAQFPLPFRLSGGRITFEATPEYLVFPECVQRIHDYNPAMKLIALLRDPVARAYSGWNMYRTFANSPVENYRLLTERRTFEEAIAAELQLIEQGRSTSPWNYLRTGMYAEHLRRYFQVFPRDSMLILEHAEFLEAPDRCLAEVCRFLGIDDTFAFRVVRALVSNYESPIPEGAARVLRSFFQPLNSDLFQLLNREFAWGEMRGDSLGSPKKPAGGTPRTNA